MSARRTIVRTGLALWGLLAAAACGDHATPGSSASASVASAPAPLPSLSASAAAVVTATPSSSAARADDVPSPADFEDDADKDIGTDNYVDELGRLEKEIDAK